MKRFKQMVGGVVSAISRNKFLMACFLFALSFGMFAEDPVVTIPVIGVSVGSYITASIALMGTVAGTAVGGYAAFLVVRKALRWLGKALG